VALNTVQVVVADVTPILTQVQVVVTTAVEGIKVLADVPTEAVLQDVSTGVILDVMDIVNVVAPIVKVCLFFSSPDGSP